MCGSGVRWQAEPLRVVARHWGGAPLTAVISYQTWQRDYAGDPAVVGGTFWVNTKAVTISGIAPEGVYGDRLSTSTTEVPRRCSRASREPAPATGVISTPCTRCA